MDISQLRNKAENAFGIFRNATQNSFHFLVTDFGFALDSITIDESMAFADMLTSEITYRNRTTEIRASYTWYEDLRGTPQVICGRLESTDDRLLTVPEAYNLDMLIAERCPTRALLTFPSDPVEKIEKTLQAYALILVDCARPELSGDFGVFPRLRNALLAELKGAVFLHSDVDADELIAHLESETS